MPVSLEKPLVIAISATALFNLEKEDAIFRNAMENNPQTALSIYRDHMIKTEKEILSKGTGFPLVKALLNLNHLTDKEQMVEVIVMSRNSPETGIKVLNSIRSHEINILRHVFTGGSSVAPYMDVFQVDLFLTTDPDDAQDVVDNSDCAVAILKQPPENTEFSESEVIIAFDGDAVIFADESEAIFKESGLEAFQEHEKLKEEIPMAAGPHARFLKKLGELQEKIPAGHLKTALVTARSAPSEMRVMNTLRDWGVVIDQSFFLGGLPKSGVLKTLAPHIFFDDQDVHLNETSNHTPAGKVPYKSSSSLAAK